MEESKTPAFGPSAAPLEGAVVLELGYAGSALCVRLSASLASKLAGDLGARVLQLSPVGGDPVRSVGPAPELAGETDGPRSAVHAFLSTSKCLLEPPANREAAIEKLLDRGVTAVIAEEGDPAISLVRERGIPVVEICGYPAEWSGPRHPLSEFTVLAWSGMLDMIGDPAREPLRLGGHQASYAAGLAAFTALSSILAAHDAGMPAESVRVSLIECMLWVNWKAVAGAQANGVSPSRKGSQAEFQVLPCLDGWVALVYSVTKFDSVIQLVGNSALAAEKFATRDGRIVHGGALYELLAPWFACRTRSEIYTQAQAMNVPLGPVYHAGELLSDAQYKARCFVVTMDFDGVTLRMPRLPVLWNGNGYKPVPTKRQSLEAMLASMEQSPPPCAANKSSDPMRPLLGIRVIDFGQLTAGANTSAMLADLGADVIKIESADNMDLFRHMGGPGRDDGWWNRSALFRFSNRNKRGLSVNMKTDEGRRLVLALIDHADIVVENFKRGVLERLGVDFPVISATNSRLILASISSQGESGPNRTHVSFGSTLDATAGLSALTGYAGDKPCVTGVDVNYPDQVVSLFASGMIVAAVREVRRTGRGALLDISQREIASFLVGEEFVAAGSDCKRGHAVRQGNADPAIELQDCFRDINGDWLAVTVQDRDAAARVAAIVGISTNPGELRRGLRDWVAQRTRAAAASELAAVHVPAAPALDGMTLLSSPDLLGQTVVQQEDGSLVKGMPYTLGERRFHVGRDAPDLGQHNIEILCGLLGLTEYEASRLEAAGVTSTRPSAAMTGH